MKNKKMFAPANEEAITSGEATTPKKVSRKSKLPSKDNDFGSLCMKVSDTWKAQPTLTLLYVTQAQFEAKATTFNTTLAARQKAGGDQSPLAQLLRNSDMSIDKAISGVKGYLKEKYEGDAQSYYSLFGIEKTGATYKLPFDREKRKDLLDIIVNAIDNEGFATKKYGTAFWTQMKTDYLAQYKKASLTDGAVSSNVGNKNTLKEELREVLDSIINLIKANYPKTWEAELRNWGYQKENY